MKRAQFTALAKLTEKLEKPKAVLIGFYLHRQIGKESFHFTELLDEFVAFGLSRPNPTRLRKCIMDGKTFIRHGAENIKLHLKKLETLDGKYPEVCLVSEEVATVIIDTILPEGVYKNTRGYIERVAKQVNRCYQEHCYDACAMMMRRLIEMLMVEMYRHKGREQNIKDGRGYKALSSIIKDARETGILDELTPDSAKIIDKFRELGNYSAHKIEYNCQRPDLLGITMHFRNCVEELLYKSKVKQ